MKRAFYDVPKQRATASRHVQQIRSSTSSALCIGTRRCSKFLNRLTRKRGFGAVRPHLELRGERAGFMPATLGSPRCCRSACTQISRAQDSGKGACGTAWRSEDGGRISRGQGGGKTEALYETVLLDKKFLIPNPVHAKACILEGVPEKSEPRHGESGVPMKWACGGTIAASCFRFIYRFHWDRDKWVLRYNDDCWFFVAHVRPCGCGH